MMIKRINIEKCHNALIRWLEDNGFSNCDVVCEEDFSYDVINHKIECGVEEPRELGVLYAQYLYEYGCSHAPFLWASTLSFLHEAGHHLTAGCFREEELGFFNFVKEFAEDAGTYWDTPDEFAANMVVVDFVNNHFDAVLELQNILQNSVIVIDS